MVTYPEALQLKFCTYPTNIISLFSAVCAANFRFHCFMALIIFDGEMNYELRHFAIFCITLLHLLRPNIFPSTRSKTPLIYALQFG
jgi:hypothetical protein